MGDASAWVTGSCRDHGLAVTSTGERAHDRPWSYAVVYDTSDIRDPGGSERLARGGERTAGGGERKAGGSGSQDALDAHGSEGTCRRVWFKANGTGTRHEPELLWALASVVPDLVPDVLAIDAERAWSLTRDAGPTWHSTVPVDEHWPLWEGLLQRYAAAQLTLADQRTRLLATGVPERSPATLPNQAADLVAELSLLDAASGGLSAADSDELTARLPAYGQWCRELESAAIPVTIQHDDLHSNNVCRAGSGSRIIDWGDASIGHPFGTMLSTLRSIAHHNRCEVDDPRIHRVRDSYLEPFTTYARRSELTVLVDVASRVSTMTRALSWRAALLGAPISVHREFDFPVRGWLQELLSDEPYP